MGWRWELGGKRGREVYREDEWEIRRRERKGGREEVRGRRGAELKAIHVKL